MENVGILVFLVLLLWAGI